MRVIMATIIICTHARLAAAAGVVFDDAQKQLLIDGGNFVTGRTKDQVLAVATDGMFDGGVPLADGPWWVFVGGTKVDVVDGSTYATLASSKSHLAVKAFNDINYDVREHNQHWPHVVRHEWHRVRACVRPWLRDCVGRRRVATVRPRSGRCAACAARGALYT